jgi:hypothetical protein
MLMKLLALLGLGLFAFSAQQPGSVHTEDTNTLLTSSGLIPLNGTATLAVASDRTLQLDPGVRMSRLENGWALSTHDGRNLDIQVGTERMVFASPLTARLLDSGWDLGNGKTYAVATLKARRFQQDDADANLKSMQESAKKLRKDQKKDPAAKLRVRWLYGENPMATSELFNSQAILQLSHISPMGF